MSDHGGVAPTIRNLLSFDREAARAADITPLVCNSLKFLANILDEVEDPSQDEDGRLERVKRQRIAALLLKQVLISVPNMSGLSDVVLYAGPCWRLLVGHESLKYLTRFM